MIEWMSDKERGAVALGLVRKIAKAGEYDGCVAPSDGIIDVHVDMDQAERELLDFLQERE